MKTITVLLIAILFSFYFGFMFDKVQAQTGIYESVDGSQGEDETVMKTKLLYRDGSTEITGILVSINGGDYMQFDALDGRVGTKRFNFTELSYTNEAAALADTEANDLFLASYTNPTN